MPEPSSAFIFRKFQLDHGSGVWKVGTDSVLLGSWCMLDNARHALDMGTGSGLLALMLAQRDPALRIDAIDMLPAAVEVAHNNVMQSPWKDRINVLELDLLHPDPMRTGKYDLVVCNPPYFPDGPAAPALNRRAARQGIGFTLWDVPAIARTYLTPYGNLHVVIPSQSQYQFIEIANWHKLFVHRRLSVRHRAASAESITLLEFGHFPMKPDNDNMVLYSGDRPTKDFVTLCGDFIFI